MRPQSSCFGWRRGERFSPTRFSLTGAHSIRGIHPQRSVRRAAKRKTLYVQAKNAIRSSEKRYTLSREAGVELIPECKVVAAGRRLAYPHYAPGYCCGV